MRTARYRMSLPPCIGRKQSILTIAIHCRAVSTWLWRGKKKQEKEGEEEGEPRTVSPSNAEVVARRLKTSAVGEPRDNVTDEENLVRR
ncbi:hypothetical protein GW17_00018028 [Ensete ventricosum]|nr:hypothetical protein GW17_00018028 [Ensete ventricosum]